MYPPMVKSSRQSVQNAVSRTTCHHHHHPFPSTLGVAGRHLQTFPPSPETGLGTQYPWLCPGRSTEISRQTKLGGGGTSKHPDSQAVMRRFTGWSGFRPASHSKKELGFGCARQTLLFLHQHKALGVGPPALDFMCLLPDCSSPGPFPLGFEFTHLGVMCHRTQTEGAEAQLLELEAALMRLVPRSQLQDSPVS